MKGTAAAVQGFGRRREGSRLMAVALIAFVSMLLIATFGAQPALADPKDKDDKGSSSSDNGKSDEDNGKDEAKEDKDEKRGKGRQGRGEGRSEG